MEAIPAAEAGDWIRLRRASAHVFVSDVDSPLLADVDAHHLGRVLRLRPGELVTASDGQGGWRVCSWVEPSGLEVAGDVHRAGPATPKLSVGFVPTKGDRPEWTVQKLTELGVDRIVVVSSQRSVVRWDGERGGKHLSRLREVARQAAMQSRRTYLPEVEGVLAFRDCAATEWAMAAPGGAAPSLDNPAVLIGPEGGWSPDEEDGGLARVDLGPTILRAETAALAAGSVLAALRAGLVEPRRIPQP